MTGHNNLLYHLHNIDNDISPACRFCLDAREEFHHLANDCPALWWERRTISARDKEHDAPQLWTPLQIVDFTFFPKINEAFAKPLYVMDVAGTSQDEAQQTQSHSTPADPPSDTDTDVSVMEVSSMDDSSSQSDSGSVSDITISSD